MEHSLKRSEHEAAILDHISALAWSDKGGKDRTHRFVERIAGHFGIISDKDTVSGAQERATEAFLAQEAATYHKHRMAALGLSKRQYDLCPCKSAWTKRVFDPTQRRWVDKPWDGKYPWPGLTL